MLRSRITCLLSGLLVCSAALDAQQVPRSAALAWLPAGVEVEVVGEAMRINGLATTVLKLHGAASARQLQDAFVSQDVGTLPARRAAVEQLDGWQLISRPDSRGFQTLQMRTDATGAIDAVFATTDLSTRPRTPVASPLRLMADAHVTSVIESSSAGARTTQYVVWSSMSPSRARQALCDRARADGWEAEHCNAELVDLSRGQSRISLAVSDVPREVRVASALRSVVVLNHVEAVP
jgi:hypothetical protein